MPCARRESQKKLKAAKAKDPEKGRALELLEAIAGTNEDMAEALAEEFFGEGGMCV